jgi:hypothetical protein
MATFAFASGFYGTAPFGQESKVRFVGTWIAGEQWTILFSATLTGAFTLGAGNIAGKDFVTALTLRNRVYLGFESSFAMSENGDVTHWEEQNPGTAVISFLSQFGSQDTVVGFAAFNGKLVVFGKQSIQIWDINADPAQFALLQTLDQSGTIASLSIQSIGDLDVLYLDRTGIRSVQAKTLTNNAFIDDVGIAVDSLVKSDLNTIGINVDTGAVAIVEPSSKQYWLFLRDEIYVLSRHPGSKIQAWSKIIPSYQIAVNPNAANYDASGNVTYNILVDNQYYWVPGSGETQLVFGSTNLTSAFGFVASGGGVATVTGTPLAAVTGTLYRAFSWSPIKFTIHNGQVYALSSNYEVIRYGGSDNNTYDHSRLFFELPWMDLKMPSTIKQDLAMDAVISGKWLIEYAVNPQQTNFHQVILRGNPTSPNSLNDSTYDKGRFALSGTGTRIKIRGTTYTDFPCVFGAMSLVYNQANKK